MSILIHGMEMPSRCSECKIEERGCCPIAKKRVQGWDRPGWCPLIEVPPHGRLIDADAFFNECPELTAYEQIAKTIIPADPGKEDT